MVYKFHFLKSQGLVQFNYIVWATDKQCTFLYIQKNYFLTFLQENMFWDPIRIDTEQNTFLPKQKNKTAFFLFFFCQE